MARHNYGRPYGPYADEEQGANYHYHYYGEAGRYRGPPPAAPGAAPGFFGPANLHRHPGADSLVKGLLIGAGLAYLLTNERAQRAVVKTSVQLWTAAQNSLEEWKERFHDAEAEVAAAAAAGPEEKGSPAD